ncbi:hypothetical protein ACFU93_40735 [Streptomyces sp. NPDC057611]|uniref:hypothetical protein n=1 Tax=Streptomyces sp. NPDC057611 TaxID=3346182 RepID=UPI00369C7148
MQRMREGGGAYGEDPYGGVGYGYVYDDEYGNSTTTDMTTLSWDPVHLTQWTSPADPVQVTGVDPHATATHLYTAGPGPATTAWDSPHGDVLTVAPPEFLTPPPSHFDAPGPAAPAQDEPVSESVRPVFVDSSGRRQRRVVRAARLLVIPAGCYVALLISTMLNGPSISSPFVPHPGPTHPATPHATAPDSPPGTGHSTGDASHPAPRHNSRPSATQNTPSSTTSTAPAATSGPTTAPTRITFPASTAPTASTASTAPTAPAAPTAKGRALGTTHRPVK